MNLDTVGGVLASHARKSPHRVAYLDADSGVRWTYAELDTSANRLANAFLGSGLEPGDRLATWMATSLDYARVYMAAAKAGLVVTPVNDRFKADEARYQIEDADVRGLIYSASVADLVESVVSPADLKLVATDGAAGATTLADLIAQGSDTAPAGPAPSDPFMVAYTSGTTGFPKGAVLTHASVRAIARMNALSYRLPIGSVGAYRGSMSFVATVCAFLMSHLHVGGTIVMIDSGDPEVVVDGIIRFGGNYTSIPTPMLAGFGEALTRRPEALDSLVTVLHGASKATAEQLEALAAIVGDRLIEGWGMTEHSGGLATATTRLDVTGGATSTRNVFESVGRAVPDAVVEVVDPDRIPLPHDGETVGELAILSPAVAQGYWRNEAATREAFVDGWYYTGDLGSIDPEGYIYISDRRSDLIVSGGINVYPSEIERVIAAMPGVAEVTVVGQPHERWGQTVVAVVVAQPGAELSAEAVIDWCRERMAPYKKPTSVVFVDALPRTVSAKVKRSEVRDLLEAEGLGRNGGGA